jgi:hypothetical protein
VICFPHHGLDGAVELLRKRGHRHGAAFCCMLAHEMCNWIDCDIVFSEDAPPGEAVIGEQQWLQIAILVPPLHAVPMSLFWSYHNILSYFNNLVLPSYCTILLGWPYLANLVLHAKLG